MVFDIRHPFPSRPLFLVGDVARFPNGPKVYRANDDEGSLRMGDEGCPNESQSVDDATGYSREEEEADSMGCEEAS
jgi:hypothetical protein